ncbi:MAG: hypothetical protein M3Y13_07650, partial [Armatimonadota bacterium]|nr:hypothetical protein [Armatimonadota bacterium]
MCKQFSHLAAAASLLLLPLAGHAAPAASDNAGNYTAGTDYAGQNGGTGFGTFTVTAVNSGGAASGTFIGSTSTNNDASKSEGNNGTPAPSTIN